LAAKLWSVCSQLSNLIRETTASHDADGILGCAAIVRNEGQTMVKSNFVYVIDDDDLIRYSVDLLLTTEGFEVGSYASAVDFLRAGPPCRDGCVITDFQMPGGLTGIDLLREISKRGLGCAVIIMTAQSSVALAVEAIKMGAHDFLSKPVRPEVLVGAVRKALANSNTG
jgi:two-component system, LuxR family, response regulator FixJ